MKKILKITLIVLLLIAGAGVLYLDATEIAPSGCGSGQKQSVQKRFQKP